MAAPPQCLLHLLLWLLLLLFRLLHLLHLLLLCLPLVLQFMMVGFSRSDHTNADNNSLAGDLPRHHAQTSSLEELHCRVLGMMVLCRCMPGA